MMILGIDPGTKVTGYAILSVSSAHFKAEDYGCIRPPSNLKQSERYLIIYEGIELLIEKYRPTALVVETQFLYKNVQTALKLGMARAAAMLAARKQGIAVFGYAPTVAKRAVVGNGRASKSQVQGMVKLLLGLPTLPEPEDAADALALAICHAQASPLNREKNEI